MAENANRLELDVRTVQANTIKSLFETLKDILMDTSIIFNEEGMKIMSMDASHVALVHLKLEASGFEYFHCQNELAIGVYMGSMYKIIKTIGQNDSLRFSVDSKNPNALNITMENDEKNTSSVYRLKMLDLDHDVLSAPDVQFESIITMSSLDLQRIFRDLIVIAPVVTITSSNDELCFECDGDVASAERRLGKRTSGINFIHEQEAGKTVSSNFALRYLVMFAKATNVCDTVDIFMKSNYPLVMKYQVASLGTLQFALAPKVKEVEGV